MSVIRRLQPSRPGVGSSSSSSKSSTPTLYLDVPAYGVIYLRHPKDPLIPHDDSNTQDPERLDYILRGTLAVTIPPGLGRRKCKKIQVGMRSICRLDLGSKRRNEEDILFDRKVEIAGDDGGVWLDEGKQVFEFNMIVPANLPQHDWHPTASIRHVLYANVEGLPSSSSTKPLFGFRTRSSTSLVGMRSKSRSKSPHVRAPSPSPARAPLGKTDGSQTPPYEMEPSLSAEEPWLKGSYSTERSMMIVYHPDDEAVSGLALDLNGVADDIGIWNFHLDSYPWSVSAVLNAHFTFSSLSPQATIFQVRLILTQTTSIISPRDDPATVQPLVTKRAFTLASEGKRVPPEYEYPPRNWPSLWRGTEAGGTSTGDLVLRLHGKLPTDDVGRPTTVNGIDTPIKVSHTLHLEVYLAVWGMGTRGERLAEAGPGGARKLVISRAVTIPSCALVQQNFTLPSYDEIQGDEPQGPYMPSGVLPWHNCACGLSIEHMETRMQQTVESEIERGGQKEEEARGRRR